MQCSKITSLLSLLVAVHVTLATPLRKRNNEQINNEVSGMLVNIRLINEFTNPRPKRSVGDSNLPDHFVFGIPVQGQEISLRMKRSVHLPTSANHNLVDTYLQDAAVYTDSSRHSAMIVKRGAKEYKMKGIFYHNKQEWNLEPLSSNSTTFESHRLFPLTNREEETISMKGDEVFIENETNKKASPTLESGRHKRAVTQHVVEIAFIVDYEDYTIWDTYLGGSGTLAELTLWFTYVAEIIRIRYETIEDADIAVSTKTIHLLIMTQSQHNDFYGNLVVTNGVIDGSAALTALTNWVPTQSIPQSDHYMLFTGYDIANVAGKATVAQVCTADSVSINEDTRTSNLGVIASHELGHCLSSIHDVNDGCDDTDQYIMATSFSLPIQPANDGNSWKFSSCSIAKIKTYLTSVTCTLPSDTGTTVAFPAPTVGQVISRDDQCRHEFLDSTSFFCESLQINQGGVDLLCRSMYCHIPNGNGYCRTVLPLEYTSCGTDKWCILGECVAVVYPTTPASTTSTATTTTTTSTTTTTTTPTTTITTTPTTITATTPTTTTTTTPTTTTTTTPTTTTTTTPTTTTTITPTTTTTKTPKTTTTKTPKTTTTTTPTTTTTTTLTTTTRTTKPTATTTTTTPTTTSSPTTTTTTTQTPTLTLTTTSSSSTQNPNPTTTTTTDRTEPITPTTTTTTRTTTILLTTTTSKPGPFKVFRCLKYILRIFKLIKCIRGHF